MTDYVPVPCAVYDRYEIAILHHTPLRTSWRAGAMPHLEILHPVDLVTREGAEYLLARRVGGDMIELRLDWILDSVPV
jgi:transcriptional antiterminator Rof (Rho-off)